MTRKLIRAWGAGDGRVDLQLRMVAAMSLDPDGVNAYVAIGKLAEQGKSWPTGYTLQLLAVRPRQARASSRVSGLKRHLGPSAGGAGCLPA